MTYKSFTLIKVCLAISLTLARQDKGRSHFKNKHRPDFHHDLSSKHRKPSKFCSNNTTAQNYLTQILSIIDVLQENSSYASILKLKSTNFITYLKDIHNQELLRSDCETFLKGLKEAKKADKAVQREQKYLAATIQEQIKQVARDVTNGKGFYEFDN
jgi:Glu-tRNA(Gln) amidotransferase subunit E-like FAD-binding protein